ncbi:MAG: precorrin-3B synthase, partial [Pseudomonadota bacterium]|nr:precorrin-3B synthase [Pseudomonadota bacterium]
MVTGDGLLVRLTLATRALRPTQWAALTAAAAVHGNGRLEISRRGNLQLRGLAADRMPGLAT